MKILILFVLAMFFSCTQIQKNHVKRYCHYDGAFEAGSNDAQDGKSMKGESLAQNCPDRMKVDVRKGYRDGYTTERASRPTGVYADDNVKEGRIRRNYMTRSCIESFGKKVCGYGCIESYGKARCARHPGHNCMDEYGKIVCGSNCREESNRILCDYRE